MRILNRKKVILIGCLPALISACLFASPTDPVYEQPSSSVVPSNWKPGGVLSWQIQFSGEINERLQAQVYDLDAFETEKGLVDRLHEQGRRVICYINAGAWEDWRPDQEQFPKALIGKVYSGWAGERWLDIRRISELAPILEARLDLCLQRGFDGVEFDNLDGYNNPTGFPLTAEDQLAFNTWLAQQARKRGLAAGLKNDPEQVVALEEQFDFAIVESCFAEGWCDEMASFLKAGKPVLAIEYTDEIDSIGDFCEEAKNLGVSLILKNRELDAFRENCE